jgi:predicted nucleic acid-binding protein
MRAVVVDASVSAKWVVNEEHSEKATGLLQCADAAWAKRIVWLGDL